MKSKSLFMIYLFLLVFILYLYLFDIEHFYYRLVIHIEHYRCQTKKKNSITSRTLESYHHYIHDVAKKP